MFEEICLVCGKHLQDDGRAYCSDDCQIYDVASPSISSASSALSSPHLGFAVGGDVPALVPSALGTALKNYRGRNRYSVSSSSASSTSWSVVTDDDDEDAALNVASDYSFQDGVDSLYEGGSKSANYPYSMRLSALSYARRPSGTNNRSTVPHLNRRTSFGSSSGHVRGIPRSAPNHSSTEEDEGYSDFGFSSRDDDLDTHQAEALDREWDDEKPKSTVSKSKRTRNRASLPAYFSLLQMSSPADEKRSSPMSSSSGNTIVRPSPPTPKLTAAGLSQSSVINGITHATPRGRRRIPGESLSRQSHSRSPHRSRLRQTLDHPAKTDAVPRSRLDSKGSVEQVFDWSNMGLPRGRTSVRRNSSPPPKMMLSAIALEDHNRALGVTKRAEIPPAANAHAYSTRARGRARAEELDGVGGSEHAPGYGRGRSGLLARERASSTRGAARAL